MWAHKTSPRLPLKNTGVSKGAKGMSTLQKGLQKRLSELGLSGLKTTVPMFRCGLEPGLRNSVREEGL